MHSISQIREPSEFELCGKLYFFGGRRGLLSTCGVLAKLPLIDCIAEAAHNIGNKNLSKLRGNGVSFVDCLFVHDTLPHHF